MQSKDQKRMVALERIEQKLLFECEHISNNPGMYWNGKGLSLSNTHMIKYLDQANNIRQVLDMKLLYISIYDACQGNLVITDGYNQFYPKENE